MEPWTATAPPDPSPADALARCGSPAGHRPLALVAPGVLWLVAAGSADLFAADPEGAGGPWHHLGRLGPGAVLAAPAAGPRHRLVLRPLAGARVRAVDLPEDPADPLTGPELAALDRGVDAVLAVLADFAAASAPNPAGPCGPPDPAPCPAPPPSAGQGGPDRTGAAARDRAAARLADALCAAEAAVDARERRRDRQAAASRRADRDARRRTAEALRAAAAPGPLPTVPADGAEPADRYAAVAVALGLPLGPAGPPAGPGDASDPIADLERRTGARARRIALTGPWWRFDHGPLLGRRTADGTPVALLRRRGGYRLRDPLGGSTRVTARTAAALERTAVTFHRPLPDGPLRLRDLLRHALRGSRADAVRMTAAALAAVALAFLVPLATGLVLGSHVPAGRTGSITRLCLALVAAGLASAVFGVVQNAALLRIEGRLEATAQAALWDRLLRLPARFFGRRSTGELAHTVLGVLAGRTALAGLTSLLLHSAVTVVVGLTLMYWISVPLALIATVPILAAAAVLGRLGLLQARAQEELLARSNALTDRDFHLLRAHAKIRVAGAEDRVVADWAVRHRDQQWATRRAVRLQNTATALASGCLPLCATVVFLASGPARAGVSEARFLSFYASLAVTVTGAVQVAGALNAALAAVPMFTRLRPLLAHPLEAAADAAPPGRLTGDIAVEHVSFGYEPGVPVLRDVSLRVRPGEMLAVVGPSGCGKSTLLRLLLGFERPSSGVIRYDGRDLAALDGAAVRRQCGVVTQHARPLDGTILQAITAERGHSLEEAWEAARLAGLDEDIAAMPMGMQTFLSDGGALSGGQRQRLAIAQALIRRPRVLFFDEATSALDNVTQAIVADSTLKQRATRIVIAHRLSTVMNADRVIVLDAGRVVQQGPPAALTADADGPFARLVRHQLR
ncbi:NHLP bacteriocin export ABC transporter permease/ATPase subunit [Streptomyces sp. NPDC020141]|uniref:NHLP bacteriocin export ABC transporter permease/ATPase subunit n=1 Tax=Streptomyces sp. NPDC020141 TaxID=3365065 RepID=UPI0037B216FE